MSSFYKEVGDSVICSLKDEQEVRYFIPENYFQTKLAIIAGEYVNLLGIFNYAIYDKNGKPISKLKTFYFPSAFLAKPYAIVKEKELKLTAESDVIDYRTLRFKDGDQLIVQKNVPQDIQNVEDLFKLFVITGNIPQNIDYKDLWKYFTDAIALSGNKWNLTNQIFGILQSEICRDPKDMTKPFRLSSAKKNKEWNNYKSISVKDIAKYTSPYAAITSERFDDALVAASMLDTAKYSPLEKVLTGK